MIISYMKYFFTTVTTFILLLLIFNCKKAVADNTTKTPPANLNVAANVSTDGTGKVSFTATADNAVRYKYNFGNGVVQTSTSGIITYQYAETGTNEFTVTVTATSSSDLSITKSITITVTGPAKVLLWSDEFNTDGRPDSTKWSYEIGNGQNGWGNNELEYYTDRVENSVVQGGVLKINLLKETYKGSAYTSARLVSRDKFAFTYGKVEIKAKLLQGNGTWPALWMLGSNINSVGWPECGEIDIMEHLGRTENTIYGTLHYPGHYGGSADGHTTVISGAASDFHIYSMEWSATAVKIYVDGLLYHTTLNGGSLPFNKDFFFIFNVAMGGNFGGAADPAFTQGTMEVDYVRVYK
jgi:beta-glucanase (GH16 family)